MGTICTKRIKDDDENDNQDIDYQKTLIGQQKYKKLEFNNRKFFLQDYSYNNEIIDGYEKEIGELLESQKSLNKMSNNQDILDLEEKFNQIEKKLGGHLYEIEILEKELNSYKNLFSDTQFVCEVQCGYNIPCSSNVSCLSRKEEEHFIQMSFDKRQDIQVFKSCKQNSSNPQWYNVFRICDKKNGQLEKTQNLNQELGDYADKSTTLDKTGQHFTLIKPEFKLGDQDNIQFMIATKTQNGHIQYWGEANLDFEKIKDQNVQSYILDLQVKYDYEEEYKDFKEMQLCVNIQYLEDSQKAIQGNLETLDNQKQKIIRLKDKLPVQKKEE